ncbi:MAG TPA: AraC family transcriptional regulator [Puia sp.]|nr:AraC family transcriptional regulator [Puia sp.]
MIARKLLTPDPQSTCPTFHFADHTLLVETITKPYIFPQHIPGAGILTMITGTGRFTINDETITLDPARYLIINQGSRLSIRLACRSLGEGWPRAEVQPLFLFFRADTVHEALTKYHTDLCWLQRAHPMDAVLKDRFEWLVRLGNSCSSFSALKADGMIREILLDLTRQALAAEATAGRLAVSRRSTRIELFKRLSQAREWIHANYASPLPLDSIAEKAQLNRQHFLRMFRDCFGATPHKYLMEVRLAAARELLADTTEPVTAICRMTGFESPPSFSGLFRRRFGTSPMAYRLTPSIHSSAQPSGSAYPTHPPGSTSD